MKKIIIIAFTVVLLLAPCRLANAEVSERFTFDYNCPRPYYGGATVLLELLVHVSASNTYNTLVVQLNAIPTNINNSNDYPYIFDNCKWNIIVNSKSVRASVSVGVSDYVTFSFSALNYNSSGKVTTYSALDAVGNSVVYTLNYPDSAPVAIVGYHVLGAIWEVTTDINNYVPFMIEYADGSQSYSEVGDVMIEVLEELQADEVGDVPDTSEKAQEITDYASSESELLESANSDVDVGGSLQIDINENANTEVWSLVDDIVNINPKIFGLIVAILSVFVIALIFNR